MQVIHQAGHVVFLCLINVYMRIYFQQSVAVCILLYVSYNWFWESCEIMS